MKKLLYFFLGVMMLFFAFSFNASCAESNETGFIQGDEASVSFNWNKDEKAAYYYVYMFNFDTDKYEFCRAVRGTEITVEELESGKNHYFKVLPIYISERMRNPGKASKKITCVTAPKGEAEITTADIGKSYISLTWSKAKGASGYRVFFFDSEKGEYILLKDTDKRKLTVKKLKSDTEYKFRIQPYRQKNGSVAFGAEGYEYSEYTHTSGVPHTKAQIAKAYNTIINKLKAENNITVRYTKEIDTDVFWCSEENLLLTVKNTANLYKGILNRKYVFTKGKSGNITTNSLFEPYSKKADVVSDDIDEISVKQTKKGYTATFKLKKDNLDFDSDSYYDGVLSLPDPKELDTTPLKITSADLYYDTAIINFTVTDKKLRNLEINGSALADIGFTVSSIKANTTVGYSIYEKYRISY